MLVCPSRRAYYWLMNTPRCDATTDEQLFETLDALGMPAIFYAACEDAYDWLRGLRESHPDINLSRTRTQRCLANDAVIRRVRAAIDGRVDMAFREIDGAECEVLSIDQPRCEIRFKKVDRMGRASNIATHRQRLIRDFAGQQYLFGRDQRAILTVGYEPDDVTCSVTRVSIAVEGGGSYRVPRPPADTVGAIVRTIRAKITEASA